MAVEEVVVGTGLVKVGGVVMMCGESVCCNGGGFGRRGYSGVGGVEGSSEYNTECRCVGRAFIGSVRVYMTSQDRLYGRNYVLDLFYVVDVKGFRCWLHLPSS